MAKISWSITTKLLIITIAWVLAFQIRNSAPAKSPGEVSGGYLWVHSKAGKSRLLESVTTTKSGAVLTGFCEDGIYRSTDNGRSWQQSDSGIKPCDINTLFVSSKGVVLAGTGRGIYWSDDDGQSWKLADIGPETIATYQFLEKSDGRLYVCGSEGFVGCSVDGGKCWRRIGKTLPVDEVDSIAIDSAGRIFATGSGYLYVTDTKDIWSDVDIEDALNQHIDSVVTDSSDRVYVICEDIAMVSSDHGKKWTSIYENNNGDSYVKSIAVDQRNNIIVATDRETYISSAGGATWPKLDLYETHGVPWFRTPFHPHKMWIDNNGTLFLIGYGGSFYRGFPAENERT